MGREYYFSNTLGQAKAFCAGTQDFWVIDREIEAVLDYKKLCKQKYRECKQDGAGREKANKLKDADYR